MTDITDANTLYGGVRLTDKNQRIDLTQFKGMTKGQWLLLDGNGTVITLSDNGDEINIRLFEAYCDDGITEDEDTINKNLMVSAPEILNALKKAYEDMDRNRSNAEYRCGVILGHIKNTCCLSCLKTTLKAEYIL